MEKPEITAQRLFDHSTPTMKIAIAQTCPFSADPGPHTLQNSADNWILSSLVLNCCHAEDRIKEAKAGGADVVCFPEYFLQGILNEGRQVGAHLPTAV